MDRTSRRPLVSEVVCEERSSSGRLIVFTSEGFLRMSSTSATRCCKDARPSCGDSRCHCTRSAHAKCAFSSEAVCEKTWYYLAICFGVSFYIFVDVWVEFLRVIEANCKVLQTNFWFVLWSQGSWGLMDVEEEPSKETGFVELIRKAYGYCENRPSSIILLSGHPIGHTTSGSIWEIQRHYGCIPWWPQCATS